MAERPPGKGGPEEGTPEYNWLYGKGNDSPPPDDVTRAVPRSTRPRTDETRVMPTMSRGDRARGDREQGGATQTSPVSPPPPPRDPGTSRGAGGRPPSSGRRLPRFRLRWVKYVLILWLIFLIAVPFWAWSKVTKVDAMPGGDRPADQPGTTYLLVGSDSRADLTAAERKELGTGGDVGQRTDTIMLLHTGSGPNLLMSIPRDSIVDIPGHGTTKINAAYAFGGPKLLISTIEQNTGIRVDDYVEIGFGGFVGMVDALGGVEICPNNAMRDPLANLDIKKGCQEADGKTALGYARSRHTSQKLGDVKRAQHQREVVSAIGSEAVSPWTVINPVRYYRLAMAASRSFDVSDGTSAFSLGRFGFAMTRVDGKNGLTCGVPISDLAVNWDEDRSQEMFKHIIEDDTDGIAKQLCTPSGLPPR
ncbi:LCP family protein [Nocardioides sp. InS609-2]|uniref:LCP family protein n=1 Tax=Nocardioides sp. InS609-2 TaxID=2760705 RepID=UPI0017EF7176|nr:LCP family protein [Nocardioides sp. InS609-2]MBA3781005.1 LCP family protein [Nocardioides sp.]